MVGEKLEGNDAQDGRGVFGRVGDVKDIVGVVENFLVAFGRDGDDRSFAGLDLLHVVDVFVVDAVFRAEENARRVLVDQGDDAVLELGGGMALGVDVGCLLYTSGDDCGVQ